MNIQREDRVKAISGHFKGKSGWVARVDDNSACVVWKGVWEHGIWMDLTDLKRTKRYKTEKEFKYDYR